MTLREARAVQLGCLCVIAYMVLYGILNRDPRVVLAISFIFLGFMLTTNEVIELEKKKTAA